MNIKKEPYAVWGEYEKGRTYLNKLGVYDQVEQNENFYAGKQWEGLNAPDLDKPVMNFIHRVVSYFISQIVTDDVGMAIQPHDGDENKKMIADLLSKEVDKVIEDQKITTKHRKHLRDAAVTGNTAAYLFYNPDTKKVEVEVVDALKVIFGNPYVLEKERQPYIIIAKPTLLDDAKDEAEANGVDRDSIQSDYEREDDPHGTNAADRVTVLIKFWKENGTVRFLKCTKDALIKEPTDTGYSLYPLAFMPWEEQRNTYVGKAAVTEVIPNQIAVNKMWAMGLRQITTMAFPKVIYDKSRINKWSNAVGEAIGVQGDPNTAIASGFRAPDMSAQLLQMVDKTVEMTRDFMGASDAALGNVRPENTSAIIAVQEASAAPLNIQRMQFYQFVEDEIRSIIDIILTDYGIRPVYMDTEYGRETVLLDFGSLDIGQFDINVDVGGSSYWNEITQVSTIDNLFAKGVITDPVTYLEAIPDSYVKNKNEIIKQLKEQQEKTAQMMQEAQMPAQQNMDVMV